MQQKIKVIVGFIDGIRISNSTFPLVKAVVIELGKTSARVDASEVLGAKYKDALVTILDYKLI